MIRESDRIIVNGVMRIRQRPKQNWIKILKKDKIVLYWTGRWPLKELWKNRIHVAFSKILGKALLLLLY